MRRDTNGGSPWIGSAVLMLAMILCVVLLCVWRYWPSGPEVGDDPTAQPRPVAAPADPTSEEKNRIEVFSKAKVSVVNISSARLVRNRLTMDIQQVPRGTGTGFIWDEKGRVVTNYHVVKGADRVLVTLDDHTVANVAQVRYDEARDLAVLWTDIPESKRKPIPLGESAKLQVGQGVLAIGNPFGLDQSLSAGIISALSREMKSEEGQILRGLIQTDAAINPGNSGGPLLDTSGRLIGVNTAIISPSGASAGIGFAIPADLVNRVVPRLISGAREPRPSLGIVEAPDQWTKQRGLNGVLIIDVLPDSPAQKAKLRPTRRDESGNIRWGDLIIGIDQHKVRSANELYTLLADEYKVGQEATLHILRDGENQEIQLTLAADIALKS